MTESSITDNVVGTAYLAGWSATRWLPERVAYGTFQRIADQAAARRGSRVQMLEANLRRVVGPNVTDADLRSLVREGMRSYLRYWCDAFRLPSWSTAELDDRVHIHDVDRLWDTLAQGRGLILALPHSANYDAAAAWVGRCGRLADTGATYTTVAERLRPEWLYERFLSYREGFGLEVLPLTGGGNIVGTLASRLRSGGLVCLPADRDLTGSGVDVEFFGATARLPGGPALLAHLTDAALISVDLWYDDEGRTQVQVHQPLEVSTSSDRRRRVHETTQRMASEFEAGIAGHPEDWHMLQPLWADDVDAAVAAKAAAVRDESGVA